ncbi:MAG: hypothetical protein OK439_06075 [Thaumarchaeota archaeon]|nr:hypothetical protein [Nitrososphaerota archaeon]
MKDDSKSDIFSVLLKEGGRMSHAEEVGELVSHVDETWRDNLLRDT